MVKDEMKNIRKKVDKEIEKAENLLKKGKYQEASEHFNEVAKLCEEINDKKVIDLYLKEIKCLEKIGDAFKIGWVYRKLALCALKLEDFSNSINFASKAIEHFSKTNAITTISWCYNIIGEAYEKLGDYDSALENYKKSIEIEYSEDINKKIEELSEKGSQLKIEHFCSKEFVNEGEKVEIVLKVKNISKEVLSDIKLLNEKGAVLETISNIKPNESKDFTYFLIASDNVKPLYSKIEWKDKENKKKERRIEPPILCIIPNIEIRPSVNIKLEVGKHSYFVLYVINNSKRKIKDVNLIIKFPYDLKVKPVTGYVIDEIAPNEEKGFIFKILPMMTGRTILKPTLSFSDEYGRSYRKEFAPFVLEEIIPEKKIAEDKKEKQISKVDFVRLKYATKFKKYFEDLIKPKEMDEYEYVQLTNKLPFLIKGFTLKDINIEEVAYHIIEELNYMYLVGEHSGEDYRLYLFSGESNEGVVYLLTIAIKEENGIIHVGLKLYSEKEDELEDLLEKISSIIKHTIVALSFATEIQKIEVKETINIIDSIVQRSRIGERIRKKNKEIDIEDSIVQRTEL
ncbi:MAG: tetratricopeptide repeat protein [Candidatus Aenigmatarchaeota archaeon]